MIGCRSRDQQQSRFVLCALFTYNYNYACIFLSTYADSEPDLLTLMAYPDGSETVDIAVRVGTSYSKFGIFLLKDGKGDIISALEKAHGRDPDVLIQEIFKKWLSGVNGVAVTWDWLVKCLYKAGLHSLGSTVENGLIH